MKNMLWWIFVSFCVVVIIVGQVGVMKQASQYRDLRDGTKIIYKLEGDHYDQVTDIGQIKDGIYIFIR